MFTNKTSSPQSSVIGTAHHLKDLLAYKDREFVVAAYRVTLGRSPDSTGLGFYLKLLRQGRSKVEILGRLAYSKEGKKHGVHIAGLKSRFAILKVLNLMGIRHP